MLLHVWHDHGCPTNEIMIVHSVENFVSIFYATTLDVHIDEAGVQRHHIHNHFIGFVYECVCFLAVFATLYMLWALEQNERCLESCVLFSFAGKTQWLVPTAPILHTFQVGHSMLICPLLGAMVASLPCTRRGLCLQFSQSGCSVFLCWIRGNLAFFFTIFASFLSHHREGSKRDSHQRFYTTNSCWQKWLGWFFMLMPGSISSIHSLRKEDQ